MGNDINEFVATGRIGKDPQFLGQTGNVTKWSLAVSKNTKFDKSTQKWSGETDWLNCVYFGHAELVKGAKLKIYGSIANNNWTDKDGKKHYDTQIIVNAYTVFKSKEKTDRKPSEPPADQMDFPEEDINF